MKEKLTIEHLAPYLPYGLRYKNIGPDRPFFYKDDTRELTGDSITTVLREKDFKPILRPLSDYNDILLKRHTKEDWDITTQIEIVDFANKRIGLNTLSYLSYITLIKDHADVFGLIEKELAINKNTL